mmetsp:Transcript_11131/g.45080  ORF Transcript_11131/g.45080 Transcript_11131/m.45080 type:complete len:272 (+) Transcript_11131:33-848(+)
MRALPLESARSERASLCVVSVESASEWAFFSRACCRLGGRAMGEGDADGVGAERGRGVRRCAPTGDPSRWQRSPSSERAGEDEGVRRRPDKGGSRCLVATDRRREEEDEAAGRRKSKHRKREWSTEEGTSIGGDVKDTTRRSEPGGPATTKGTTKKTQVTKEEERQNGVFVVFVVFARASRIRCRAKTAQRGAPKQEGGLSSCRPRARDKNFVPFEESKGRETAPRPKQSEAEDCARDATTNAAAATSSSRRPPSFSTGACASWTATSLAC